ncbi:MAG: hypothetical protein KC609_18925, partial [Myxococcales bacterium]|nr:hypothetical protein [Myxococcales bacterium]
AEEAMTLVGDLQLGADGIAARLVFAEALYRTGDAEGAFAALRTARNQLSSAESNVDQVALRKSFTEGVWENQRTTRLAREWGLPSY